MLPDDALARLRRYPLLERLGDPTPVARAAAPPSPAAIHLIVI